MQKNAALLGAVAIVAGTIFGAGAFGLPYALAQSGPAVGLFWFAVIGGAVLCLHLMYGSLQSDGNVRGRLISLVSGYFGTRFRFIPMVSTIVGAGGALLAYIIVGGYFLDILFDGLGGLDTRGWSLIFGGIFFCLIFVGLRSAARLETIGTLVLFFGVWALAAFLFHGGSVFALPQGSLVGAFVPYGIILFSLYGANAIPEAIEYLEGDKKKLVPAVVIGTLVPLVTYIAFAFSVLMVVGSHIQTEAISSLTPFVPREIVMAGAFIGFLAIATSFVVVGAYLADTLHYDMRINARVARICAGGIPIILFMSGIRDFALVTGTIGSILGGIDGILISLMFMRQRRLTGRHQLIAFPALIPALVVAIFSVGIVGEIVMLIAQHIWE